MENFNIIKGLALVAVSLAAAASAHASTVVLPTAGFTCQYTDATTSPSGANCAAGIGAVAQLGAGGLSYSVASGGVTLFGTASLLEGTFGQVATAMPVGTSISYSYDFFLTETLIDPNWAFELQIVDDTQNAVVASTGFIDGTYGTSRTEFTSPGTILTTTATNPNDVLTVEYIIDLTNVTGGGNPFSTLEVPAGTSIDIQTITTASTPEPGSLALLAGGLAWLGWKLRRRDR
jgi:hypothetical protein